MLLALLDLKVILMNYKVISHILQTHKWNESYQGQFLTLLTLLVLNVIIIWIVRSYLIRSLESLNVMINTVNTRCYWRYRLWKSVIISYLIINFVWSIPDALGAIYCESHNLIWMMMKWIWSLKFWRYWHLMSWLWIVRSYLIMSLESLNGMNLKTVNTRCYWRYRLWKS